MRFYFNDPYSLWSGVERLTNEQPVATRRDRDNPIPVDVYQDGNNIVIEGAVPGARLEDLELNCEDGLLTVRGTVAAADRDFAVREIPRGSFSRTLALPTECEIGEAKASFENGIVRITLPRQHQRTSHTIKVEVAGANQGSRIVMEKPGVIDAVKGADYRDVQAQNNRRKGRAK